MAKFSSKEKIQAVKRYLDGTESGKTIAKSIRQLKRIKFPIHYLQRRNSYMNK
ncbi:hypothetical protein MOK16_00125 [Bacillus cereus]|uniref:hypothetical protein n=1 Tax=Bacillus cereus TaxID=1396 RepID=UPI001F51D15B|nr:hypothetical protein [Bacillus cereus]MCI0757193.1 hypothetical protein [Bacillus cereus]